MTHYIKTQNRFTVAPDGAIDIRSHLPVGSYIVKFDDQKNMYFLEETEPFGSMPSKLYGNTVKDATRILSTYKDRTVSTGVLLLGEKGSGKTMLAKLLSTLAFAEEVPTLIINSPFCGDTFNKFVQDIDQPCVIMFDEFEKIYDKEEQEQMLTLLDGVFPSKKLFILTCNDKYKMDVNLINRPGRIFYAIEYKGLEIDFVREYLNDNLKDKTQIDKFVNVVSAVFDVFNFDMMKAIVEEMNRYGDTMQEAMRILNTRPSSSDLTTYDVSITLKGEEKLRKLFTKTVNGNPLASTHEIYYSLTDEESTRHVDVEISSDNLTGMDVSSGTYTFDTPKASITLTRRQDTKSFDFMNAF